MFFLKNNVTNSINFFPYKIALFKRSIHFKYDKDSSVDIPHRYVKDNKMEFYITDRLLHSILRLKNSEAMTDFKPFQKKFRNFTKKQPENMLVFSSSLIFEEAQKRKSKYALLSPGVSNFLQDYQYYEINWERYNFIMDDISKYIYKRSATVPGLAKESFMSLNEVQDNQLALNVGRIINEEVEKILHTSNVCYILKFSPKCFYVGSTLNILKPRLLSHKSTKPPFEIYNLFCVREKNQLSSRVLESAIHAVCSENLGISVSDLETVDDVTKGYNVVFKTERGMDIALHDLFLSNTYDLREKIFSVSETVLESISHTLKH